MAIVLGIDKFMSECRALTNLWCRVRGGLVVGGRTRSGRAARQSQQTDRSIGHGNRDYDGL